MAEKKVISFRYPMNIGDRVNKVPYIIFTPYQYKVPAPDISLFNTDYKREPGESKLVAMYMPGDFSESINASWSPEATYQGGNGASLIGTFISNLADKAGGVDGGKLLSSATAGFGAMPYPTDVNIFRGADPMSFTLNFTMIPNDEEEGNNILGIIENFKKAILPRTMSAGEKGKFLDEITKNVLLKFPDIWDIQVVNMKGLGLFGVANKDVTYQNMCLTNCNMNYISGTEGAGVYYNETPIGIKMSLSFTSLRKHYVGQQNGNLKD